MFVFAAATSTTVVHGRNYTGNSMILNCSTTLNFTDGASTLNITWFYNASGGATYPNYSSVNPFFPTYTGNLTAVVNVTANNLTHNTTQYTTTINTAFLSDGYTYNFSCIVNNKTIEAVSFKNVTIDNTPPEVNFSDTTSSIANGGSYKTTDLASVLNINVSVADVLARSKWLTARFGNLTVVYINITNSTGQVNFTKALNLTRAGVFYNMTIDMSSAAAYADGKYNFTIWANDTIVDSRSGATNLNNSEYMQISLDRVAPTSVVLTRGTGTTRDQNVITITIVDSGTVANSSGIATCTVQTDPNTGKTITGAGAGTQTLIHTGLTCSKSYSYVATCLDNAGNSKTSISYPFTTGACYSGTGSGGSSTTAITTTNILSIDFGVEASLANFEENMGIKEIKISVTEDASNVKVIVKKFNTQPPEITVSKTGEVHKYIQIETTNLASKLEKAIITIEVQKNWLSDKGVDKANVGLFKLDESLGEWNEISLVYKSEDDTYYYYDAEVTSFSYFAIAGKFTSTPGGEEPGAKNLTWLWITLGAVVVALIIGGILLTKKKK